MTAVDLKIECEASAGQVVVHLNGDLDDYNAPKLMDTFADVQAQSDVKIVYVTLDGLAFLDSVGLGAIVKGAQQIMDSGKQFKLVCVKAQILKLLERSGLISPDGQNRLDVVDSVS